MKTRGGGGTPRIEDTVKAKGRSANFLVMSGTRGTEQGQALRMLGGRIRDARLKKNL